MAEESPTRVSNDELMETCLILIQQLFSDNQISDQERDHLKGKIKLPLEIVHQIGSINICNAWGIGYIYEALPTICCLLCLITPLNYNCLTVLISCLSRYDLWWRCQAVWSLEKILGAWWDGRAQEAGHWVCENSDPWRAYRAVAILEHECNIVKRRSGLRCK